MLKSHSKTTTLRSMVEIVLVLGLVLSSFALPSRFLPSAFAGDPDNNLQIREMGTCADAASRGGAGGLGVVTVGLGIDGTLFNGSNYGGTARNGDFAVAGIPAGATIVEASLYWNGSDTGNAPGDDPGTFNPGVNDGDPTVFLQALPAGAPTQVASVNRIGGPAFWTTADFAYAYQADVSAIVTGNGSYRLSGIENLDNYINGAELMVVYRETNRDPYYVGIAEGLDLADGNSEPTSGPGTKAVVYQFEPAQVARTAELTVFFGGAGTPFYPDGETSLWYRTDVEASLPVSPTNTSIINDVLATETVVNNANFPQNAGFNNTATAGTPIGASGGYWDSLTLSVNIPAGNTWLAVQMESQDTTPTRDHIEWVGSTVNVPLACPEVVITKTRTSPDQIQPGDPVVYELLIENVGDTDVITATLQDVYDTTYLDFVSAVSPNPDSTIDDGTLDWATGQGIGPIPYGGSKTITVNFTAAASTEPIVGPPADRTPNVATVTGVTDENGESIIPADYPADDPGTPEDENPLIDDADVEITDPSLSVVKSLVSPASGQQVGGQPVVFDIIVTNDGDTTWDIIPLTDTYTTTHLTYNTATLAPLSSANDGTLDWSDITGAGSLTPGNSITVRVTFTANQTTTGLPNNQDFNVATVSNPTDENGDTIPDETDDAPIQVLTPASIGDRVWIDSNGNGVQDGGDVDYTAGTTVRLYDAANLTTPISTTTTSATGLYTFNDLFPGNYVVEFVKPAGFEFTKQDSSTAPGYSDANDSDANQTSGQTASISLSEGENDDTVDAGIYELVEIGDYVWIDTNGDGLQAGESGLNGVLVTLTGAGPDGIFGTGDDTTDTDTTTGGGLYSFPNLPPGDYQVNFATPGNYVITVQDSTVPGFTDATDSDADPITGTTDTISMVSGVDNDTIDAGMYEPASLGNFVWEDLNGDGLQIGELGDGVQGVTVTLSYAGPDGVFGNGDDPADVTDVTDATGAYGFSDLAPGDYQLNFEPISGHVFTVQDSVVTGFTDANDSDANPTTGDTTTITLVSNEDDSTWDAGLYQPIDIGDFAWIDNNGDGLQTGETGGGLQGVTVTLSYAGPDGVIGNGDDPVDQTFVTDANGAYIFTNLPPGDYQVNFDTPTDYVFTIQDSTVPGSTDLNDSDANPATGDTVEFSTTSGIDDLTRDAGLYIPASLGNYVWIDSNGNGIQDETGTGLGGVDVDLLYAGPDGIFGNANDTASDDNTSFAGEYGFTNLAPGNYRVTFNAPAAGAGTSFEFTTQDSGVSGAADTNDSDANPTNGQTVTIPLVSGQNDPTWDAGLVQRSDVFGQVREDVDGDGNLTDPDSGIPSVQVVLWSDPDGNPTTLDGVPVMTTTTDATGLYTFTNVFPGNYILVETDLTGFGSTGDSVGPNDNWVPISHVSALDSFNNDFLDSELVTLGDFVWEDRNGDGVQNDAAAGIGSVQVDLLGAGQDGLFGTADDVTDTTTTNGVGLYSFTDLFPGTYIVTFTAPSGYQFTIKDSTLSGGNDATDSDADPATGQTANIILTSGNDDDTIDAGLYRPITLGDTIFRDPNGNTTQDVGENDVIAGVPITATNLTTGKIFTTTSDSTSPTGNYLFDDLPPGLYTVEVPAQLPLLLRTTPLPTPFLLQSGDIDLSKDFGYINPTAVEFANVDFSISDLGVTILWTTASEDIGDSFTLYRGLSEAGARKQITPDPIYAYGNPTGSSYEFLDSGVGPGSTYYYWIEVSPQGSVVGPLVVPFRDDPGDGGSARVFIPLVVR